MDLKHYLGCTDDDNDHRSEEGDNLDKLIEDIDYKLSADEEDNEYDDEDNDG